MRYETVLAILSAAAVRAQAATGELGDADAIGDNPAGVVYKAALPEEPFSAVAVEGNVKGYISATSLPNGEGVAFKVKFSNLPAEGGPFGYHIHVDPVPEDGNCTQTLAHLDPFIRGEDPACDSSAPETCQVGDLSGKYGKVDSDPFEDTFVDPYATLKEGLGAYFGNRSFVLHFANKTRITCANFEPFTVPDSHDPHGEDEDCDDEEEGEDAEPSQTGSSGSGAASGTGVIPRPTESLPPFTASAVANGISLLTAFAAFMFAL